MIGLLEDAYLIGAMTFVLLIVGYVVWETYRDWQDGTWTPSETSQWCHETVWGGVEFIGHVLIVGVLFIAVLTGVGLIGIAVRNVVVGVL